MYRYVLIYLYMEGGYLLGIDNLPDIVTPKQLADFLQVSDQTIKRAIKSEKLKAFKVGKDWRIEKEAVKKWLIES